MSDDRVTLHFGVATDVGHVREVNEDSHLTAPPVFVVADGMGGHDGGDVASRIVVEEFARWGGVSLDPDGAERAVLEGLEACRDRLGEYAATHRGRFGGRWHGGTTVVVAILVEDASGPSWLVANLGDSRAYRVARGELHRVSRDHSVVQELVESGRISEEEASGHPERHVVTRALFAAETADPDFFRLSLAEAERLLLCSDGITDLISDSDLGALLTAAADPATAATEIVAAALDAGGIDNATALVVDVMGWVRRGEDDSQLRGESHEDNQGAQP